MAETIQDNTLHFDQGSIPLSSELSPDFDDVSVDSEITPRHHERLHKLRTWWSKKRPTACITFPSLSDSSDSDDDFGDDVDDVIFALARCRAMRVVGKLTNIQQSVEMIYRVRYGPTDLHDATCVINLSDGHRSDSLDDIRWGQVMLLNSVDILQSKISMVRRLFLAYKMNMSKYKSDPKDCVNHDGDDNLVSTQSQERGEMVLESEFASKRHKIVHNLITSQHHHEVIPKLCSLFLYLIKPSLFSERDAKTERKAILEDAFRRIRVIGLQDCLNDQSWNVLDCCHLPNSSIVSRCINLSTFFTVVSHDDPKQVRTVTSYDCDLAHTPSSMISQYQDIIVYFRNTALFCAYVFRRLKSLEQELCVAMKHFGEMRDKRLKNCKPVSDGDELLRRVMMKSEAVLEMNEIANTSTSPEECRAKRFMIKGILRIEKRAESLMYRFASWRRSREFPSPRRINNYRNHDGMRKTKPEPRESRVFYKMTLGGIIIQRFCIARDSLVRKAFSRSTTIGLNDAILSASKPHWNLTQKHQPKRSMHIKEN